MQQDGLDVDEALCMLSRLSMLTTSDDVLVQADRLWDAVSWHRTVTRINGHVLCSISELAHISQFWMYASVHFVFVLTQVIEKPIIQIGDFRSMKSLRESCAAPVFQLEMSKPVKKSQKSSRGLQNK